jgi:hypothetical protein
MRDRRGRRFGPYPEGVAGLFIPKHQRRPQQLSADWTKVSDLAECIKH